MGTSALGGYIRGRGMGALCIRGMGALGGIDVLGVH